METKFGIADRDAAADQAIENRAAPILQQLRSAFAPGERAGIVAAHQCGVTKEYVLQPAIIRLSAITAVMQEASRQRERARVTALLLGAFVILLFFITIAKTGMNW